MVSSFPQDGSPVVPGAVRSFGKFREAGHSFFTRRNGTFPSLNFMQRLSGGGRTMTALVIAKTRGHAAPKIFGQRKTVGWREARQVRRPAAGGGADETIGMGTCTCTEHGALKGQTMGPGPGMDPVPSPGREMRQKAHPRRFPSKLEAADWYQVRHRPPSSPGADIVCSTTYAPSAVSSLRFRADPRNVQRHEDRNPRQNVNSRQNVRALGPSSARTAFPSPRPDATGAPAPPTLASRSG